MLYLLVNFRKFAFGGKPWALEKKEKKGKKDIKKKKDPQAPKKPAGGAYGCFLAKNRAAFMKECSGQPVTAVTKLASAKWKDRTCLLSVIISIIQCYQ